MSKSEKLLIRILSGNADNNIKFEIILYWSEENAAFIAEVPELPGCKADGDSYADALKNAEQAIQIWLETADELGRNIPEARGKLMFA